MIHYLCKHLIDNYYYAERAHGLKIIYIERKRKDISVACSALLFIRQVNTAKAAA